MCDVCGYVDFKLLLRLFHETVCVVISHHVGGLTVSYMQASTMNDNLTSAIQFCHLTE